MAFKTHLLPESYDILDQVSINKNRGGSGTIRGNVHSTNGSALGSASDDSGKRIGGLVLEVKGDSAKVKNTPKRNVVERGTDQWKVITTFPRAEALTPPSPLGRNPMNETTPIMTEELHPQPEAVEHYVNAAEAAKFLSISRRTLMQMAREGVIPAILLATARAACGGSFFRSWTGGCATAYTRTAVRAP